ncbi:MAG: adenine phosphoribosyltransferase [Chloroflexi bacterium]|nr:adenine phosphoribosyltransferase [Chloroflexota bacterium]
MTDFAAHIRDIPDFPKKGIVFKDVTTLLKDGPVFREAIDQMVTAVRGFQFDRVVGMESRGFIFAAPIAHQLGVGFVPVRKLGKLPGPTISAEYDLEYGSNTLEIHQDGIDQGSRVLIVDDLLATGGTVSATIALIERLGGSVTAAAFLVELQFLHGRERLRGRDVVSLVKF